MENKEKENKKSETKKQEQKPEKKTPERDFEKEIKTLNEQIISLNAKVFSLELENQKQIETFKNSASVFEKKAQEKLNEYKEVLNKKAEEEKLHHKKFGSQKLLEAIIEPLLNIELAINHGKHLEGDVANYVRGFEMLLSQLNFELESFGVTKIEPKVGDEFDPICHYAISTKEGNNKNKIVEVKKPGYKLHDRVIKPATVVIEN